MEKGNVDAQFILLDPPPPLLFPRLPLARPVLPVAATYTKESTSTATTGPGDTLRGITGSITCGPPLYLGACIRRGNLSCLFPQNVPPIPELGKGNVSGMLLTYLHGSRLGTDTYVLGLPTTVARLSSSSNIRQSW